ncbi:MAG: DsbA family protein [Paracoccaceae bacterium]
MRPILPAALLALTATAALPQQALDEAEVKRLALEAILENPEIVMQAVELLERRAMEDAAAASEAALAGLAPALERDPLAPVLGNPDGDVTLVEFFDYNCPFCRRGKVVTDALVADDPELRVVLREWPVLGEESVFAARAALAARAQDLYPQMHAALMALEGRATQDAVLAAAQSIGADMDRLAEDMASEAVEAHLTTSMALARELGFEGTPSYVVGGQALLRGFVETDEMRAAIAAAREAG